MRLALPAGDAPRAPAGAAALHDARLLAEHDAPLGDIERWLGESPDWAPCGDADAAPPAAEEIDVLLGDDGEAGGRVALVLGAERLARLGATPVPAALGEPHFPPVEITLALDRFRLDATDLAALGPGALLLLPASFARSWRVGLRTASRTRRATFDAGRGDLSLELDTGAPVGADPARGGDGEVGVTLRGTFALERRQWRAAEEGVAARGLVDAERRRARVALGGREDAFDGELVAIGDGWAVRIDATDDERWT